MNPNNYDPEDFEQYPESIDVIYGAIGYFIKLAIIIIVALSVLYLTGCASQAELKILADNSTEVAKQQASVAKIEIKTIVVDCTQGCGKAKITYVDPRDRQKVTGIRVHGTNDVIMSVAPSIIRGVGYVAGAIAATQIVSDLAKSSAGGVTTTTNNNITGDNNAQTTDNAITLSESNGNQANGNQANSEDNDITNTTTEDNDITNTTTEDNDTTTTTTTTETTTTSTDSNDATTTTDSNDTQTTTTGNNTK